MKRIREYLNENVFLPRKVIIFSIVFIVLAASILFGRMYIQKDLAKRLFIGQTSNELYDMEHYIKLMLEDDISIEKAEEYCTYLLTAIVRFEAVMEAGHHYLSHEIHWGDIQRGFDGVRMAILGDEQFKLEPLADGGISQNERLFLQELLSVVEKLLEPQQRCCDGTATTASSFRVFLRAYSAFENEWWVDGDRGYPSVSPFERLRQPY